MLKAITVILIIVLSLFSLNIYYEVRNTSRVQAWYDELLDDNGAPLPNIEEKLFEIGFRTVRSEHKHGGEVMYVIYPPFDQGILTTFSGRHFFPIAVYRDSNGNITGGGLYK